MGRMTSHIENGKNMFETTNRPDEHSTRPGDISHDLGFAVGGHQPAARASPVWRASWSAAPPQRLMPIKFSLKPWRYHGGKPSSMTAMTILELLFFIQQLWREFWNYLLKKIYLCEAYEFIGRVPRRYKKKHAQKVMSHEPISVE